MNTLNSTITVTQSKPFLAFFGVKFLAKYSYTDAPIMQIAAGGVEPELSLKFFSSLDSLLTFAKSIKQKSNDFRLINNTNCLINKHMQ